MSSVSASGERILAILDLFTEARPEWSSDEMMAALGYSRPTLYRYLKTLRDAGYIVSLPQSGFTLGPRVTELDFLMRRSDPLIATGRVHLEILARSFPSSVFLVRWYGTKLLCIASEVSTPEPLSAYPRGRPMPIGRGAISRAIIAALPGRERRAYVTRYLAEFTGTGAGSDVKNILNELKQVRRDGVATARGEVTPGVIGVAAPILAAENAPLGAICLTSPETAATETRLEAIRTAVRTASAAISNALQPAPALA